MTIEVDRELYAETCLAHLGYARTDLIEAHESIAVALKYAQDVMDRKHLVEARARVEEALSALRWVQP